MFAEVDTAIAELERAVAALEPARLDGVDARRLAERFARAERLAGAGKALAARRVAATGSWRRAGAFRDAAGWLASVSGVSATQAHAALTAAHRVEALPATDTAWRAGELSLAQADAITDAASTDEAAEAGLLASASRDGLVGLRRECARVKAAACSDEAARAARIRAARSLQHWTDADGTGRIDVRGPVADTARVLAALAPYERERFEEARKAAGEAREGPDAYAFDALVTMATRAARGAGSDDGDDAAAGTVAVPATVVVRIDHSALRRGFTIAGELCEIAGVGPITVAEAGRLLDDAFVKAVVFEGTDVTRVAHLGRRVPARLRTAVEERDPECVVEGCHVTRHLEIDHNVPIEAGGPTALDNLERLCPCHHDYKHRYGLRLAGAGTRRRFVRPDGTPPHHDGRAPP
jgi:hypothetical protein